MFGAPSWRTIMDHPSCNGAPSSAHPVFARDQNRTGEPTQGAPNTTRAERAQTRPKPAPIESVLYIKL